MKFVKIVFYEIQKEKENKPDYYYYCEQAKGQEKNKNIKNFFGVKGVSIYT